MCFHTQQSKSALELEKRFKATLKTPLLFSPQVYNGFDFPTTPVITNTLPHAIQLIQWGLIPSWAHNTSIQQHTLNARVETLLEKPSFKGVTHQRCLVLADAFFEWQWLDSKGKQKQQYKLELPNQQSFAFAGLWSNWHNPSTQLWVQTYTIITTQANDLMSEIHNTKKRMPIVLDPNQEQNWLENNEIIMCNDDLVAHKIGNTQRQLDLF